VEQSRHRHGQLTTWIHHTSTGGDLRDRVDRSMGIRLGVWVLGGKGVLIHNHGWVAYVPSIDSGSLGSLTMMTPLGSRV
jgi:hypothetical protein